MRAGWWNQRPLRRLDLIMYVRAPSRPAVAALLAAATGLLAACSGGPELRSGPQANPSAARGLLAAASTQGPVPLVIDVAPGAFAGGPAQIAGTASNAVAWLGASFAPESPGAADPARRRVVFRFDGTAADPNDVFTSTGSAAGVPPSPPRLLGVFCDGPRPVADVTGTATGTDVAAADELVTSVTDRLFPGSSEAGYSRGAPGLSLGVGVGSGGWGRSGWGVGGGLFF